jgi:hypothetical protein
MADRPGRQRSIGRRSAITPQVDAHALLGGTATKNSDTGEIRTNEGRWVGAEVGPEGDDDGDDEGQADYRHRHLRLEAGLQWQQCN